ncbi:MAG: response regulator [Flavobacteriales bacterium]|jgi:signal transduction histidine kinase/DNA-binding response OmpR family regulator|nr:response regulator [Flavobacteriales bacterium]
MKNSKYILAIILTAALFLNLNAQEYNTSYKYSKKKEIDYYLSNIEKHLYSNNDSTYYYINLSKELIDNTKIAIESKICYYYLKGKASKVHSKPLEVQRETLFKGLKLADSLEHKYYKYGFSNLLAISFVSEPAVAKMYFQKVIKYAQELNSPIKEYVAINNLTMYFISQQDTVSAKENFLKQEQLRAAHKTQLKKLHHYHFFVNKSMLANDLIEKISSLDSSLFYVDLPSGAYFFHKSNLIKMNHLLSNDSLKHHAPTEIKFILENQKIHPKFKEQFFLLLLTYYFDTGADKEALNLYSKYREVYNKLPLFENPIYSYRLQYYIHLDLNSDSALYYLSKYTKLLEKNKEDALSNKIINYEKEKINNKKAQSKTNKYTLLIATLILISLVVIIVRWHKVQKKEFEEIQVKLAKETKKNVLKNEFLEVLTHEIKTPITLITNSFNNQNSKSSNQITKKSVERLKENIDNLISYSKDGFKEHSEKFEFIPINDFFKRIINGYQTALSSKNIEIIFTSNCSDFTQINFTPQKLNIVLSNIISNAIKHSFNENQILVNINVSKEKTQFIVKNHGKNIAKEDLKKVFQKNFKGAKTSDTSQGLGLYLTRKIILEIDGKIDIYNTQEGVECIIELPLETSQHKNENHNMIFNNLQNDTPKIVNKATKNKILIIEDNIDLIEFYQLIMYNYQLNICTTVEEAILQIQKNEFDCILCDLKLPDNSGMEVQKYVVSNRIQTPLIIVSGSTNMELRIQAYKFGVQDYMTKPFDKRELLIRIENVIKNFTNSRAKSLSFNLSNLEPSNDDSILDRTIRIIQKNISNHEFTVKDLAVEMFYSESQLRRLIKKESGLTPNKLIQEIRMRNAYALLKSGNFKIYEVRNKVGIPSSHYFAKVFKSKFGFYPSDKDRFDKENDIID